MNIKQVCLLILIVFLAFSLRFYKVTEIPPSLNWDEVSITYNAYSILKTGLDEWGVSYPLHFKSYGEYKLPAQIYASIPGIAIFGLNELGVRITPIIYGSLTVLLLFFLGRLLFKSTKVGLLSAFLLAISPWHIHLTRGSFESSFAVFWVVLGMWLLIKGFSEPKWGIVAMIPFAISVYTYNSARVFTPLFLLTVLIIYFKFFKKDFKHLVISLLVFGALLTPLIPFLLSGEGSARYKLVSVSDDPGLIPRINENRGNSLLPQPLSRFVHNKLTYISFYYIKNYLEHFSPQFLFISGAPHKQHHVQEMGMLYWFQAPFLLLGLYLLFREKHKYKGLLTAWVLIAFLPVATTNDSIPHALRTLIASPWYQLVTAFGLVRVFELLKKKEIRWGFVLLIIALGMAQFSMYINNYYTKYPKLYSRDWQYGYKQIVEYIENHYGEYDKIVFTRHWGEPHMFTLFYMGYDPEKFREDPKLNRFETYDWIRVLNFDKFYFPDLGDEGTKYQDIVNQYKGEKILFIGKYNDFPIGTRKLETIKFLNGDIAFEIVDNY